MNPMNLVRVQNVSTAVETFRQDVLHGLSRRPKSLPPKYFYDQTGSRLFDRICETPEYYLTRTEIGILSHYAREILRELPTPLRIIELGSGSSVKTRILLEASVGISSYIPIDICKDHLLHATQALGQCFPRIAMSPVCADYTQRPLIPLPETPETSLVFFPGSTFGNLEVHEAHELLQGITQMLGGPGYFLVGIDLRKDRAILERAYNDAAGVTAAFNLNLLHRMNLELDADFDLENFQHKAIYKDELGRIEMHLYSRRRQSIRLQDLTIPFDRGESIHTESSYKYNLQDFTALCERAGFEWIKSWTDPKHYFAVALFHTGTAARRPTCASLKSHPLKSLFPLGPMEEPRESSPTSPRN